MRPREQAAGRSGVRVDPRGSGSANVDTGLPVLDRLVERLAEFEVSEAGRALGRALAGPLRTGRGYGFALMTSSEALANVVVEISETPLLVSNVDLTQARIGGLGTDIARRFLEQLAEGAGLTLHVRLLNGTDTQHVLEAIFKALGVALAHACEEAGPSGR
jgi:imidazoleglycerol-phosphate dehydratase